MTEDTRKHINLLRIQLLKVWAAEEFYQDAATEILARMDVAIRQDSLIPKEAARPR